MLERSLGRFDLDSAVRSADRGRQDPVTKTGTQHGAWTGAGVGALVGIIFPPAILGAAIVGAGAGGLIGHLRRGISRGDLKELGDELEAGSAAVIVIGESKIEEQLEKAVTRANKLIEKQIDADADELSARSTRQRARTRRRSSGTQRLGTPIRFSFLACPSGSRRRAGTRGGRDEADKLREDAKVQEEAVKAFGGERTLVHGGDPNAVIGQGWEALGKSIDLKAGKTKAAVPLDGLMRGKAGTFPDDEDFPPLRGPSIVTPVDTRYLYPNLATSGARPGAFCCGVPPGRQRRRRIGKRLALSDRHGNEGRGRRDARAGAGEGAPGRGDDLKRAERDPRG